MRLDPHEVKAIKAAARLTFGENAVVRLYGSRVNDDRRGGDIDVHVETDAAVDSLKAKWTFLDRLFERIDEQRVDVIVTRRGTPPSAIEQIAYRDGIVL